MLNAIKNIINRKEEFLESAQAIYEDAIDDIENRIVEDADIPSDTNTDSQTLPETDETSVEDKPTIEDDNTSDDDILNMNMDNKPGSSESTDDIFDMSIDIKTNTLTDILPVPPMNAGDAVVDNIMDMQIGDGFGESSGITDNKKSYTEAISIDASNIDEPKVDEPAASVKDDTSKEEPNNVTDAVIDKVNEAESVPVNDDAKDKLLDKLDKLNKGIIDLKENIKKHIS